MGKKSIACIAILKDKVLIAHRNPVGAMGDRWEFPGGKVENGETDQMAIIREFTEEFGVTVTVGNHISDVVFEHDGKQCQLHAYEIFVPHDGMTTPYVLTEHTEYQWVDPYTIPQILFVDSDLKLYPHVMDYLKKEYSL